MKKLVVTDEFRTNPLALTPGGSIIEIVYKDGRNMVYDKIKSPAAYIAKLNLSEIKELFVNGREFKIVN
jgi:hypothetical protein